MVKNSLVVLIFMLFSTITFGKSEKNYFTEFVKYKYETKHSLMVAAESFHHSYKEPGLMEQDGYFEGARIRYTYNILPDSADPENPFGDCIEIVFISFEGSYAAGETDYKSYDTGSLAAKDNYIAEFRSLLGVERNFYKSTLMRLHLGFAYRYLLDDSGGYKSNTGDWGYDRESNYYYMPIGLTLSSPIGENASIGIKAEYDLFWSGKQKSHLEDIPIYDLDTLENKQNRGFGARASVFFKYKIKNVALNIEPFVRYWDIEDSEINFNDAGLIGIEPQNTTLEAGLLLGVEF